MHRSRFIVALAAAFGAMTVALALAGVLYNLAILAPAAVFGAVTSLLWMHGTGRLAARVYRRVERQAATNGGPSGSRSAEQRERAGRRRRSRRAENRRTAGRERRANATRPNRSEPEEMSRREASRVLGVEAGADQETIKRAYRERVKDVHPDAADGDTQAFKRVRTAYERLEE
ncbi:Molecular chaperone DnaJ family protein [Halorhabdus tiamatea SARL4B]|uniref:Heat shock protein DnaJ domain protein n=1 Tax=Halorhabdus tiamatea SARL4B TaxID=1033806 RepID=F7PIR4_9EURY|nr:J domain-containing protein [Halorhabdus tiamatea]ERJ05407.1 Molecular chaperone DnaJ family protein [Halorhabdus tiamatea SARL4B]CCQ33367.1 heat shock protein DnaJ domain protein [Halorhabdus tiamatea SARL4B]